MKSRNLFRCFFAVLAFAFAPVASAENEAWYFPNGLLYVPYVKLLDKQGNTVATYSAFFKKCGSGWKFKLDGLSEVSTATESSDETYYAASPVVTNYIVFTTTSVNVTGGYAVSDYTYNWSNSFVFTNVPTSAGVTGTWDFTFNETGGRTYTGTEFGHTTNAAPISTNCTLTLTQTGSDVEGSGTVDSSPYSLSGEVTNDFFVFTMLAGTTNAKVTLAEVRALVGDDIMTGDYSWSTADGTQVKIGDFTANKQ